tara:strand:+ start:1521 stop:4475 length:2955 start_codon:yes stop_codon:yes gene_type:complete
MFKRENIDKRVQEQLFNKISALDRRVVGTKTTTFAGTPFFSGDILDTSDKNPISEFMYRNCFAKVSVAVPNKELSTKSNVVQQPISISSYVNQEFDTKTGEALKSITQKNTPLTFLQGFEENPNNRFRGHSGITKISVSQMKYYTYKYTIDWNCPDPVYFEDTFEPSFLKLGAYIAIEFGWGIEDNKFQVPPLTIEEMKRLLDGETLLERNRQTAGNYYCGVGVVTKFDWKIGEDGGYSGNIEVITPGASALLESTQGAADFADVIPDKINKTIEKLKAGEETDRVSDKDIEKIKQVSEDISDSAIKFNTVIANLKDVFDEYLDTFQESNYEPIRDLITDLKESRSNKDVIDALKNRKELNDSLRENEKILTEIEVSNITQLINDEDAENQIRLITTGLRTHKVKNPGVYSISNDRLQPGGINFKSLQGELLNVKVKKKLLDPEPNVPDYYQNRYFCTWGFFEDKILNDFFGFTLKTSKGETIGQEMKSQVGDTENECGSTKYLYTLGLDSVILPNKHNPIINLGFGLIDDKKLIEKTYTRQQRGTLRRIHGIYDLIDETFDNFETTTNKKGSIRNMVFPMEMFQKHFQSTSSIRQSIRNFWADVTNQYGGYWGFQIGESNKNPGRVGVYDSNYSDDIRVESSTEEEPTKMFTFPIFSKDSIVKSFDVSLDLSAEAAILARYGRLAKNKKPDGKKDLGVEAWNILTGGKTVDEVKDKQALEKFNNITEFITDINYNREKTTFYEDIDSLKTTTKTDTEIVEGEITNIVNGVGIYDARGNLSSYFKNIMTYLINFSDAENTGSLVQESRVMIPISVSFTLDGVGGLQVGNLFKVDYLPETYRDFVHFMITKIEHTISTTGWDTSVESVMIADMKEVWQKSGKQLQKGLEDYLDLFKITEINEFNKDLFEDYLGGKSDIPDPLTPEERIEVLGRTRAAQLGTTDAAKKLLDISTGNAAAELIGQEGTVQTQADTQFGAFEPGQTAD